MVKSAILVGLFITSAAFASKDFAKKVDSWGADLKEYAQEGEKLDVVSLKREKAADSSGRTLASNKDQAWYESKMSPELKGARKKFLAAKSPEELEAILVELDKNFDAYPTDLKFFAAQVIPLRTMRSVVWRMVPVVSKTKISHSVLLTYVKQWAVSLKIFFPTEQWNAGFRYVTEPFFANEQLPRQFQDEADIQGYMGSTIYKSMLKAQNRLAKLDMSDDIVWDNQFLYGESTFVDAIDRYRLMNKVELLSAQANVASALATIAANCAYSAEGTLALNAEIAKEYGWDSFSWNVTGVPAAKTVAIIRKHSEWGTLMPNGRVWMDLSYKQTVNAIAYGQKMIWEMEARPAKEEYFTDTSGMTAYARPIKYRTDNLVAMIQGQKELRSAITGETVVVNIPAFFTDPPADLKDLYAVGFNTEPEMKSLTSSGGASAAKYRNYLHGRSNAWEISLYKKYFPNIKSNDDLPRAARILSQSWGGIGVSAPLTTYLQ